MKTVKTDPTTEAGRRWLEQLARDVHCPRCPDDHDVMKPVPNRADRRRATTTRKQGEDQR